jgi:hypothetical protein
MLDGDYMGLNHWVGLAQSHGAVWAEADAERMDGNYNERSMAVVHQFYRNLLMSEEIVQYIERMQTLRHARTRHGVSYEMECKRASGEPDTSFGNTILSICMALIGIENYTARHRGAVKQVLLCVLGDDVLMGVIFSKCNHEIFDYRVQMNELCNEWKAAGTMVGQKLTTSSSQHLCKMSYLSGVFWPVKPQNMPYDLPHYYPQRCAVLTVALGVKPGRWFLRAGWILDGSCDFERAVAIFHGSLVSNDFLTAHVPVISNLVHILKKKMPARCIRTDDEKGGWKANLHGPSELQVDLDLPALHEAFELRYGLNVRDFATLLKQVEGATLPVFVMHPHVLTLIKEDA